MKKVLVAFVMLVAALGFAAPAQASSGQMSWNEALSYCYTGQSGCLANTRHQVEDICGCTGDYYSEWINDSGVTHMRVDYNNQYGHDWVRANYLFTDSGFWRIARIDWCNYNTSPASCGTITGVSG